MHCEAGGAGFGACANTGAKKNTDAENHLVDPDIVFFLISPPGKDATPELSIRNAAGTFRRLATESCR
jgi:hypothetical protein